MMMKYHLRNIYEEFEAVSAISIFIVHFLFVVAIGLWGWYLYCQIPFTKDGPYVLSRSPIAYEQTAIDVVTTSGKTLALVANNVMQGITLAWAFALMERPDLAESIRKSKEYTMSYVPLTLSEMQARFSELVQKAALPKKPETAMLAPPSDPTKMCAYAQVKKDMSSILTTIYSVMNIITDTLMIVWSVQIPTVYTFLNTVIPDKIFQTWYSFLVSLTPFIQEIGAFLTNV
jgi:hypothetical protein